MTIHTIADAQGRILCYHPAYPGQFLKPPAGMPLEFYTKPMAEILKSQVEANDRYDSGPYEIITKDLPFPWER